MSTIEFRNDGIYTVRDVFGVVLERKVEPGWDVLLDGKDQPDRFGYVWKIDPAKREVEITDIRVHNPLLAPRERIPFYLILAAHSGFYTQRHVIFDANGRKIGLRDVRIMDDSPEAPVIIGIVNRKTGYEYVDLHTEEGKWVLRPTEVPKREVKKAKEVVVYHCPRCAYVRERKEGPGILYPAQVLTCPNDRTILIAGSGLEHLGEPRRCSFGLFGDEIRCENEAQWSFNGFALCQDHLQGMADMNGDNFDAVREALEEVH